MMHVILQNIPRVTEKIKLLWALTKNTRALSFQNFQWFYVYKKNLDSFKNLKNMSKNFSLHSKPFYVKKTFVYRISPGQPYK